MSESSSCWAQETQEETPEKTQKEKQEETGKSVCEDTKKGNVSGDTGGHTKRGHLEKCEEMHLEEENGGVMWKRVVVWKAPGDVLLG